MVISTLLAGAEITRLSVELVVLLPLSLAYAQPVVRTSKLSTRIQVAAVRLPSVDDACWLVISFQLSGMGNATITHALSARPCIGRRAQLLCPLFSFSAPKTIVMLENLCACTNSRQPSTCQPY